ncbi:uncharacterized protein LOC6643545 isoform X2 [Drosophila willistoni]|uniref:uncharacterized protein LOC6643545 isoform X2 n=1 Tax=Drosophila willistoni TaxID=7260 RepID=UPI000C26D4FC|nr:uncharacterized protein LOC6643545 isoform X2 [Drosophila willistoni]
MANDSPTLRQLAYLDELKMRLDNLRDRQMDFIAQTAKILESMSSSGLVDNPEIDVPAAAVVVAAAAVASPTAPKDTNCVKKDESTNGCKIKDLVQRFEDLRKTSEQFTDLPVPQELVGVDVRRLLTGYEKLIEDGNVLQQSWYLLKKSTENLQIYPHGQNSEKSISNNAKTKSRKKISKNSDDLTNWSYSKQKYGRTDHARWGPLLQLLMRLNPLHRCQRVKSRSARQKKFV